MARSSVEKLPSSSSAAAARIAAAAALACAAVLAVSVRLFSVVKYESVIHEFDPYFNFRVTKFLSKTSLYRLWDWFDDQTWYPLGRVVGGTVYPGLIWTAGAMFRLLHALNLPVDVQEVCVFTAPLFSALTALSAYALASEVRGRGAGLVAASLAAVVPSYVSRSVAGSYDNEGVAIFALVTVFWLYVKTLRTGSLGWAAGLCVSYLYMVASWGGYSFIINLLPIHCLACVASGRLTPRLYVAYAPLVAIGTLEAASIPVVGFNAVLMSEHFGAFLAFAVLHAALAGQAAKYLLPPRVFDAALRLGIAAGACAAAAAAALVVGYVAASPTFGWTGRSLSLLDPTYASKHIPIIASVSEHQPPAWSSYFTDLHAAALLAPAGILACFYGPLDDAALFLVLYGITSVYFSGVMVRLMLVLAPAACCLAGLGLSGVLSSLCASLKTAATNASASGRGGGDSSSSANAAAPTAVTATAAAAASTEKQSGKASSSSSSRGGNKLSSASSSSLASASSASASASSSSSSNSFLAKLLGPALSPVKRALPSDVAAAALAAVAAILVAFLFHSAFVAAEMYSAPSIVMQSRGNDGSLHVFDDFREAYAWLRFNTARDAKVASWWDYGYQTTAMADRAVIVDNNTWNNTHIATVGRAMSLGEKKAWAIYRSLDVSYVFVVFGGFIGYPSDDINKFLWMVRIGGGEFPGIREDDYMGADGQYRIDSGASKTMLNSLMYKLSYYRFADASAAAFGRRGWDRVRSSEIAEGEISLKYFEEVFTSQHWLMRVYRVRDPAELEPGYAATVAAASPASISSSSTGTASASGIIGGGRLPNPRRRKGSERPRARGKPLLESGAPPPLTAES